MCGILCCIKKNNLDKSYFEKLLNKMEHRGPDSSGIFCDDFVQLGHRRLSIMDLSELGKQPMESNCKNYLIIYNGEVYNHRQIKKELESLGWKFKSNTDTEVILNGYIQWGGEIFNKISGMYALIIYNKNRKEITVSRDRSGIKPLYMYLEKNEIWFSSELKGMPDEFKNKNEKARILYYIFGYIPEPQTIYKNITMIPSGVTYLIDFNLNIKTINTRNFKYELKTKEEYEEVVTKTKKLVTEAISRQLVSDANIGTFLSGGLDSSIITAISSQYRKDIKTVSVTFDLEEYNEQKFQDIIVGKYNTQHHVKNINKKIFEGLIFEYIEKMEQPTTDGLNTYMVSLAAKEAGLKTVLSGLGADEYQYGYSSMEKMLHLAKFKSVAYSISRLPYLSQKYKRLKYIDIEEPLSFYFPVRSIFNIDQVEILTGYSQKEIRFELNETINNAVDISLKEKNIEDQVIQLESHLYMKNQLLRDADIFSMAHGIEVRVPFLDDELIDYSISVPYEYKKGNYNKQILVDAFKNELDHRIYNRKKMGFSIPFEKYCDDFQDVISQNEIVNNSLSGFQKWAIYVENKI